MLEVFNEIMNSLNALTDDEKKRVMETLWVFVMYPAGNDNAEKK